MSGAEAKDSTAVETAPPAGATATATTVEQFCVSLKSLIELNEDVGNSINGLHVAEPQTVQTAENVSSKYSTH